MNSVFNTSARHIYFYLPACMIILLAIAKSLHAEEPCTDCVMDKVTKGVRNAAIGEGLILTTSYIISLSPYTSGLYVLLSSPFMATEKLSNVANISLVASVAAIGLYDMSISTKDGYNKRDVLTTNFIAYNSATLLAMSIDYFTNDKASMKRSYDLAVLPRKNEITLRITALF